MGGGAEAALALSGEEKGAAAVWLVLHLAPAARTGLTGSFGWRAAVVHCGNAALGPRVPAASAGRPTELCICASPWARSHVAPDCSEAAPPRG